MKIRKAGTQEKSNLYSSCLPAFLMVIVDYSETITPTRPSFQFMYIAQDAARNAHREHRQISLRLVLDAARHIDDNAGVQLDLLIVENHRPLAGDDVVE